MKVFGRPKQGRHHEPNVGLGIPPWRNSLKLPTDPGNLTGHDAAQDRIPRPKIAAPPGSGSAEPSCHEPRTDEFRAVVQQGEHDLVRRPQEGQRPLEVPLPEPPGICCQVFRP
jgi:hypothetical protein